MTPVFYVTDRHIHLLVTPPGEEGRLVSIPPGKVLMLAAPDAQVTALLVGPFASFEDAVEVAEVLVGEPEPAEDPCDLYGWHLRSMSFGRGRCAHEG